jgi:pyruvate dehydrogenase E1 component alpha subunit
MSLQEKYQLDVEDGVRKEMLRTMLRIREFETRVRHMFADGEIPGFLHLYIGQEAVATGVCQALDADDYLTSTHRGHGHCVARGLDTAKMAAELYGRKTGYCDGKGGSMHIADVEAGMLGANGIVAGGIPIATGAALSAKMRGTDQVAVPFFGDGAPSQGAFHESFNLAGTMNLPLLGIIENNGYGEMSGIEEQHPAATHDDMTTYGVPYGAERYQVDGMDVEEVYAAAKHAVETLREDPGPALIECLTYRFVGHHEGDSKFYRTDEEEAEWEAQDPIETYPEKLIDEGVLTTDKFEEMHQEIEIEIDEAIEFARESEFPEPSAAYEGLYSNASEEI